jgi:ABC-type multidrug transport system fused ATPase/permease subunit
MRNTLSSAKSELMQCVSIFSKSDRRKIIIVILLQISLGFLDLLGVILIGLIGALAVTGIQSSQPGNRLSHVLEIMRIDGFTFQQQTAILGLIATGLLVGRTIISALITRKVLFFIGRRSAVISGELVWRLLGQNNLSISSRSIQETIYSVTAGVVAITLGVVGTFVGIIADLSLLLVMATGLLFVNPTAALGAITIFCSTALILNYFMQGRAVQLGRQNTALSVQSSEKIAEILIAYREATAKNRRSFYAREISDARFKLSDVLAELNFMPSVSKYVFEITMVVGAVSIAAIQFIAQDSRQAIATLAVFLAAGTRIAPAILRVQQGVLSMKSNMGSARTTLVLIKSLPTNLRSQEIPRFIDAHEEFDARIEINSVSFSYPNTNKKALENIDLIVPRGTVCAIVGPSGSGKTTLVDLILGMFSPDSGSVSLSGTSPQDAIHLHSGAIGYVPQEVGIIQGTVRENVALGFPLTEASDDRVNAALEIAQLHDFVHSLPRGIDTELGPNGILLSGGQKQRIGIARAMFTMPRLLIMDESTSALDAQTEISVSQALAAIPYDITLLIIAHRLSTIRHAEQVVYIEQGRIVAKGSFENVRRIVQNFDQQAKIMGL